MPNRMMKESLLLSRNVGKLTDFQYRLWSYLILYVDDYGRAPADPELIRGQVFTRRKGITETQIRDGLQDLASAGMIRLYEVDEEPYLYFPKWAEHQRIQSKKSKYPGPEESTVSHGESRKSTVSHGESPSEENRIEENRIEVETEVQTEEKPKRAPARVSGALDEELKKFASMRRDMGKPMTEVEKSEVVKLLDENKADAVEMIRQSLQKGWLHIYPLKNRGRKKESWESEVSYDLDSAMGKNGYSVPKLKRKE